MESQHYGLCQTSVRLAETSLRFSRTTCCFARLIIFACLAAQRGLGSCTSVEKLPVHRQWHSQEFDLGGIGFN